VNTFSRTGDAVDAVVVGAGINGLVAAAELAIGGWSVVLVDANDRIGGFIATEKLTEPGYRHDTYSSFHPMFISGAAYGALGAALHRHGMEYLNTDGWVTGSVSERGVVLAHRDPIRTIENFEVPSDRDTYLGMLAESGAYPPQILAAMNSELTPWRLAQVSASTLHRHRVAGRANLVAGQQHILDPSRVPDGKALLSLQLHEVPSTPRGDSAGQLDTSAGWDEALQAGYADRVLRRIEAFAPGLRGLVRRIRSISPTGLESVNRNAISGDGYAGSAELDQTLFWRPVADAPHHRTAVQGLWQIGASTHPGPGLSGASGHLAAQQLLARRRK
jgi:phytoene dehydrogenase-like protein